MGMVESRNERVKAFCLFFPGTCVKAEREGEMVSLPIVFT